MSKNENNGGVSLLGVVQIVFIILKLVGVIAWSWWLVLLPLEISVLLLVVYSVIAVSLMK